MNTYKQKVLGWTTVEDVGYGNQRRRQRRRQQWPTGAVERRALAQAAAGKEHLATEPPRKRLDQTIIHTKEYRGRRKEGYNTKWDYKNTLFII